MAKFLAEKLPIQFQEYKEDADRRKSDQNAQLSFSELTEELQEII